MPSITERMASLFRGKEEVKNIERFSTSAQEALRKRGYLIYQLQGKSLKELHKQTGQPTFKGMVLQKLVSDDRVWVKLNAPPILRWGFGIFATEAAINPNQLFLPNSADKSFKYHQGMVRTFSQEISNEIPDVKAVIGEASHYVELALMYRVTTGRSLFGEGNEFRFTATRTSYGKPYEESESYEKQSLVKVGEDSDGIRCFEYYLGTWGNYNTWIIPLIVPVGVPD